MNAKQLSLAMGLTALAVVFSYSASAQFGGGRGGGGMSPEQRAAAWKVEADGVAHSLKLSGEQAAKLTSAYTDARESHSNAMAELRKGAQPGPGMFEEMQALNEAERSKLHNALGDVLSGAQLDAAMSSLGTFNNQWDRLADTYAAFQLSEDKKYQGLDPITQYVVASDKARTEAMAAMDFESMRTASQALKEQLDASLQDVLSAEQHAEWVEKTAPRQRGGGGGRGGGQRPPR